MDVDASHSVAEELLHYDNHVANCIDFQSSEKHPADSINWCHGHWSTSNTSPSHIWTVAS